MAFCSIGCYEVMDISILFQEVPSHISTLQNTYQIPIVRIGCTKHTTNYERYKERWIER